VALPAAAASRIEKELALAPGGSFLLDTDAGSVTLAGTSESKVQVVITSKNDDIESRFDFEFDESPAAWRSMHGGKARRSGRGSTGAMEAARATRSRCPPKPRSRSRRRAVR